MSHQKSVDCLFCKIIEGKIPCKKAFENERVMAFHDISPIAPIHVLFVHRQHTPHVNEMISEAPEQLQEIFQAIKEFTESNELFKKGFRVITNIGKEGGQSVHHTHFHVLGGRPLEFKA